MQLSIRITCVALSYSIPRTRRLRGDIPGSQPQTICLGSPSEGQTFFVFSSKELRKSLERGQVSSARRPHSDLERQRPSLVVSRRNATVTMEELPPDDSPACRAVLARLDPTGLVGVLAVGTFERRGNPEQETFVDLERRRSPIGFEGGYIRPGCVQKKRQSEKGPCQESREGDRPIPNYRKQAVGFGFADAGGGPHLRRRRSKGQRLRNCQPVLRDDYREQKRRPREKWSVVLLNESSDPVQLCYGICSVTGAAGSTNLERSRRRPSGH